MVVALGFVLAVALTLYWFATTDFYRTGFSTTGIGVTGYLSLRVLFAAALAWVIYFVGEMLAQLVAGRRTLRTLHGSERVAASFLLGAGTLHPVLLGICLAGLLTYPVALGGFIALLALSTSHFADCIRAWKQGIRATIGQRAAIAVLVAAGLVLVLIKSLYPGGGHDYFDHYFPYYRAVVETGRLMNEVWYHFFYSKGAGLYFVGMLLTDDLAPQLISTAFIFCAAVVVFSILRTCTARSILPYVGAALFLLMFIYTPGTGVNRANGGWGDLEKLHEIAAVFILGIVWAGLELALRKENRALWIALLLACIAALTVVTTPLAVLAGFFLGVLAASTLLWKDYRTSATFLASAAWAGFCFVALLGVNYANTGMFLDSLLIQTWQFLDLQKVSAWGTTLELLHLHNSLTGLAANEIPITWEALPVLLGYLRLDIWWPVLAGSAPLLLIRVLTRRGGNGANPRIVAVFGSFWLAVGVIAMVGGGRPQPISFYRLSAFSYGPTLCATLIAFATVAPATFSLQNLRPLKIAAGALVVTAWALVGAVVWQGELMQTTIALAPVVVTNSLKLATGNYSLEQAYENQQGMAGRLPWGGIYPGIAQAAQRLRPGTPIWSLHIHSYCMVPDCNVRTYQSFRFSASWPLVYYGEPEQARAVLQQEGLNYFFYSHELGVGDPLPSAPLFSPDHIKDYLAVAWSDGTSFLLTWPGSETTPITEPFLREYQRNAVENNPQIGVRVGTETWRDIAFHVLQKGPNLRPFALPWGGQGEPLLTAPRGQALRGPD